jgi:hypothetical protein
MRAEVADAWPKWITDHEGSTNWLYPDTHRNKAGKWDPLPTTGIGLQLGDGQGGVNSFGLALPWRMGSGSYARESTIQAEWETMRRLGPIGPGGAYKKYAALFLDESVVTWCFEKKTQDNWAAILASFPNVQTWPASAQLAIMDMAWWMGAAFFETWPKLSAALHMENFFEAAKESISVAKAPRDYEHQTLFMNAGKVVAAYPVLSKEVLWTHTETVTLEIPGQPNLTLAARSSINTATFVSFQATIFSLTAWYVQRMLRALHHYTLEVDGLWGKASASAWDEFLRLNKLTGGSSKENLTLLSNKSKLFLEVY